MKDAKFSGLFARRIRTGAGQLSCPTFPWRSLTCRRGGWLHLGSALLLSCKLFGAADLYIKDTPADTGTEACPPGTVLYLSDDIWVLPDPDPNWLPTAHNESFPPWTPPLHQNPEYRDPKGSRPNYVYVRVRNRGTSASAGTERLRVYWATASTGLAWPAQWVDYTATFGGCAARVYGMEITKERKNATTATPAEQAAYIAAINLISGASPQFQFPDMSFWHKQDQLHQSAPAGVAHFAPAFLPWHRELIHRYEILLREADPLVTLLYWDWQNNPNTLFTGGFMGPGVGTATSLNSPFNASILPISPLSGGAIARNLNWFGALPQADPIALGTTTYDGTAGLRSRMENGQTGSTPGPHARAHIRVGADQLGFNEAAEDPFFFLIHGNVDRLWAKWQRADLTGARLDFSVYGADSTGAGIAGSGPRRITPASALAPWDGSAVGDNETSLTGTIRPWTVADGYISAKSGTHPSIVFPPVYDDAPLTIPILQPGEAAIIEIPWYPPNPAHYSCFGDPGHFCLLARIETQAAFPFGMTTPEGPDVGANTCNNNNIAWKNLTVVDNFPGFLKRSSMLVRNVATKEVLTAIRFRQAGGDFVPRFLDFGSITVQMPPELTDRWVQAGGSLKGAEFLGRDRFQLFAETAEIAGLPLRPEEAFPVQFEFRLHQDYAAMAGRDMQMLVEQVGQPDAPEALVGGVAFVFDLGKLVLVRATDTWLWLAGSEAPEPNWVALDFDDSKWNSGPAPLGYGSSPTTTVERPRPGRPELTSYFRKRFNVEDLSAMRSLWLGIQAHDGAIVYMNGKEVHRRGMPEGVADPTTPALGEIVGLTERVAFPVALAGGRELLREGENLLAVEVHPSAHDDGDLGFALELFANPADQAFPPRIEFVSPSAGARLLVGDTLRLQAEAIDPDGAIQTVTYAVNGTVVGEVRLPPYTLSISNLTAGSYELRAVVQDVTGLTAVALSTAEVVPNLPPEVAIVKPHHGQELAVGETIFLEASASDRGGAVTKVEFFVQEDHTFQGESRSAGTVSEPPFQLQLAALAPGHYLAVAVADDNAGAARMSDPVPFTVAGPAELRLRLERSGDLLILTWDQPHAVLESSAEMSATAWTTVAGAHSPYHLTPSGSARFFRLRGM